MTRPNLLPKPLVSHPVDEHSDSDNETHPAEALIIRKAEQASTAAAAGSKPASRQAAPAVSLFPASEMTCKGQLLLADC